jgi:hypothetical protein
MTPYLIGETIKKYNDDITDIIINKQLYKLYVNNVNKYRYCKSDESNSEILAKINIKLSNIYKSKIDINELAMIIYECVMINNNDDIIKICDELNIFSLNTVTKYKLNKKELYTIFNNKKFESIKYLDSIPKELLLKKNQLYEMLITEIERVNTDINHNHYIVCNNNDIMNLSVRFVYSDGVLGKKMHAFNEKHNYNYFEINMILSDLHPFLPPKITYIKPRVETILISNILGLDVWQISSWNSVIPLDWLVSNLAIALESHFDKYLDMDDNQFDFIEIKLLELQKQPINNMIDFKVNKFTSNNNNKYWKSGTGYGSSKNNNDDWDVNKFIDANKALELHSINILESINKYINDNDISINEHLYVYILTNFKSINLLNFNNSINLYKIIIDIIDNLYNKNKINQDFINNIVDYTNSIVEEIKIIINTDSVTQLEEIYMLCYLHFIDTIDKYKKKYNHTDTKSVTITDDIKDSYCQMVKKYHFIY